MIGDVYGDLVVIGESGNNSLVMCRCGTVRMYPNAYLRSSDVCSCGCKRNESPKARIINSIIRRYTKQQYINPTGMRFGKLTVVRRYRYDSGNGKWICRCDCGNEIVVKKLDLFRHVVTDCGHCAEFIERKRQEMEQAELEKQERMNEKHVAGITKIQNQINSGIHGYSGELRISRKSIQYDEIKSLLADTQKTHPDYDIELMMSDRYYWINFRIRDV